MLASPAWEAEIAPYLAALRALGRPESTVAVRAAQLRRFARDHASLAPFDVTLDDLLEWLGTRRWDTETRRAQRAAFRSFYKWAHETSRVKKNPAKRMPVIPTARPMPRPATDSDYARALAKADSRERLALRLAAELGMRCEEVAKVNSRDLQGAAGDRWLTVHGKGGKLRLLPISDDLAGAVLARGEGFAFNGNRDGHLSPEYMSKLISSVLPPAVTMHMLRHRFATKAYNVDRDVFTVQQLLGHASPATTQRYVQVDGVNKRRLVDAVAGDRSA